MKSPHFKPPQYCIVTRGNSVAGFVCAPLVKDISTQIQRWMWWHPASCKLSSIEFPRAPVTYDAARIGCRYVLEIAVHTFNSLSIKCDGDLFQRICPSKEVIRVQESHYVAGCSSDSSVDPVVNAAIRFADQRNPVIHVIMDFIECTSPWTGHPV